MKYTLLEDFFSTPFFQKTVSHYFDTVLAKVVQKTTLLDAKGKFIKNGEIKADYYDMPYHTHILSGLIPSLYVYEQFIKELGTINEQEEIIYLKVFILGYTFHDSNKLFSTETLEIAIKKLETLIYQYDVISFFPEFEQYKNNVFFLNLLDEDRTSIQANKYTINLNPKRIKEHLGLLCKFADGLASSQNLGSVEYLYKDVSRCLTQLATHTPLGNIPISFVQIRSNPYTLLSQNILQSCRIVLKQSGKTVLYATRDGFIYFGEDITTAEYQKILTAIKDRGDDVKHLELTKIDAQKCTFDFLGTKIFTTNILHEIIDNLQDKFLALSPNGANKIQDYAEFINFTTKFIQAYDLPILVNDKDGKLYLNFSEDTTDTQDAFIKIFCLNKIKWLNAKNNKAWKTDLEQCISKDVELSSQINLSEEICLKKSSEIVAFIQSKTKSSNALLKTYLNFIKSATPLLEKDEEEVEEYIEALVQEILSNFNISNEDSFDIQHFFEKYFTYQGQVAIDFLNNYQPFVPIKAKMCAFTGGLGKLDYKEGVAFGMKARGFSNRTITSLKNNTSHISELFAEENKLRKSNKAFPKDANQTVYIDFFESQLDINRDILAACVKAKNIAKTLNNYDTLEFSKNAKFQYNLYNLEFAKLSTGVENTFFFIRKYLLMIKTLGLRAYVTGIMSPYVPHKEVFLFENAPRFVKQLGWDKVRLIEVEQILEEIKLVLLFGKNMLESNLLKIAASRRAYFKLYNELNKEDRRKVYDNLEKFIQQNSNKIHGMTTIKSLVDIAVQLESKADSGANETWLIRTALDFIRKNVKQGISKEDTIEQISGEIYRKLRLDKPNLETIELFATSVYVELFEKMWGKKILNINREKEWIYQFAFVFKRTHQQRMDNNTANKIERELKEKDIPVTIENIEKHIGKKRAKYAEKYYQIIQNKKA